MSPTTWWALAAPLVVACGCTVDSGNDSFGNLSTTPAMTSMPPVGGTSDGGAEGTAEGTATGGAAATDSGSDTAAPMTTSAGTGDGSDGSGGTTGAPVDEQPDNGMYSHCTGLGDCVGLTTCVLASGDDGFCSRNPCATPATDCDPAPGGSAPPACVDYTVGGVPTQVCALDCSGGQACPGGMICADVAGNMVCV